MRDGWYLSTSHTPINSNHKGAGDIVGIQRSGRRLKEPPVIAIAMIGPEFGDAQSLPGRAARGRVEPRTGSVFGDEPNHYPKNPGAEQP